MDYDALEVGHWNRDNWLAGASIEAIVSEDFMGGTIESLVPYDNEIWRETFPEIYTTRFDFDPAVDSYDDPAFFPNPTGHVVTNNVVICNYGAGDIGAKKVFNIGADVYKFSTAENNILLQHDMTSFVGADYDEPDYTVRENSKIKKYLPDFEIIPFNEIGLVEE